MQPTYGTLYTYPNAAELADAACQAFQDLAAAAIESNGKFRVALSGGSTPQKLYHLLAQASLPWEHIELFWGDERNVPHDHSDSNFRMVKETLLIPGRVPETSIFAVPTSELEPATGALQYERTLRQCFGDDMDWPEFDLVLLGMGDDAHTASLFPGTKALTENSRWFVENWVPKFSAFRLTLTAPAINSAANVWFLITGENKRRALGNVWGQELDSDRYPSQLIRPEDGVLWWMVAEESMPTNPNHDEMACD